MRTGVHALRASDLGRMLKSPPSYPELGHATPFYVSFFLLSNAFFTSLHSFFSLRTFTPGLQLRQTGSNKISKTQGCEYYRLGSTC